MAKATILHSEWFLGFHDRGLGHGDFAVVTEENMPIVKCGDTLQSTLSGKPAITTGKELAEHIIELHNCSLKRKN